MPYAYDPVRGSVRASSTPFCRNRSEPPLDPPEESDADQCEESGSDEDCCLYDFLDGMELD